MIGVYAGSSATAYISNSQITADGNYNGYTCTESTTKASIKSHTSSIYIDNCSISSHLFVLDAEYKGNIYISNSTINRQSAKVDANGKIYIGVRNNFTKESLGNKSQIVETNEVYKK